MYFGSGDWGDNQCGSSCILGGGGFGGLGVLYPAASPYVTVVGGTSLFLNRDGSRAYETGWETGESLPSPDANRLSLTSAPALFI
jgi:subtilase family serine protease